MSQKASTETRQNISTLSFGAVTILVSILTCSTAFAQKGDSYLGVTYAIQNIAQNDTQMETLNLKAGYYLRNSFALEAMVAKSVENKEASAKNINGSEVFAKHELDQQFGIYGKWFFYPTNKVRVFALAGYTATKYQYTGFLTGTLESGAPFETKMEYNGELTGLTYGGGISIDLHQDWDAILELHQLPKYESDNWGSVSLGVTYQF